MQFKKLVDMAHANADTAWDQLSGFPNSKGSHLINVIDTLREWNAYHTPEAVVLAVEAYLARWNYHLQGGK